MIHLIHYHNSQLKERDVMNENDCEKWKKREDYQLYRQCNLLLHNGTLRDSFTDLGVENDAYTTDWKAETRIDACLLNDRLKLVVFEIYRYNTCSLVCPGDNLSKPCAKCAPSTHLLSFFELEIVSGKNCTL